jgi:hypothetical protein
MRRTYPCKGKTFPHCESPLFAMIPSSHSHPRVAADLGGDTMTPCVIRNSRTDTLFDSGGPTSRSGSPCTSENTACRDDRTDINLMAYPGPLDNAHWRSAHAMRGQITDTAWTDGRRKKRKTAPELPKSHRTSHLSDIDSMRCSGRLPSEGIAVFRFFNEMLGETAIGRYCTVKFNF